MAELTTIDEKLGEVIRLAMASKGATDKIAKMIEDDGVATTVRKTIAS